MEPTSFHGAQTNIFPNTAVHVGLTEPHLLSQIDSTFFLETKTQHLLDLTPRLWLTVKLVVIAKVVILLVSMTTHTTLESQIHLAFSILQRTSRLKLAHQLMFAEIAMVPLLLRVIAELRTAGLLLTTEDTTLLTIMVSQAQIR